MKYTKLLLFLMICLASCGRKYNTQPLQQDVINVQQIKKDALMTVNKEFIDEASQRISLFVKENDLQMQTTQSGLWYAITEKGNGKKAEAEMIATLSYTVSLLDGSVCYSSQTDGLMTFMIGYGGVETGLEEAVLLLNVGDKAHLILPPHLAHGLPGDGNCIPQRTIIIYEIELISLQ